jgi:hypothetical protein
MSAKHTPMVVAAARVLAQRAAAQCNVDAEDNWKVYGEDYLREAEAALNAAGAPELLEALQQAKAEIEWWQDEHGCCAGASTEALAQIDAAIAKATGGAQ